MFQSKIVLVAMFMMIMSPAFADICQKAHDQAAALCSQDFYHLPTAANGFEDRSATATVAALSVAQTYARCDAAVNSSKTMCRIEFNKAQELNDTSTMDTTVELGQECASGTVAQIHASILRDKMYADSMAQSAQAQRSIATSNDRSDRTNTPSPAFTTIPAPLLGSLIGL